MPDKHHPQGPIKASHTTYSYASDPIGYIIDHGAPPVKASHAPQHAAHPNPNAALDVSFDRALGHPHHQEAPAAPKLSVAHNAQNSEVIEAVKTAANALVVAGCFTGKLNEHICAEVKAGHDVSAYAPIAQAHMDKGKVGRS